MCMSIRSYAKHRGVSHPAVRKAIATGRIVPETDGTIDPATADAQWDANTRPGQNLPFGTPPVSMETSNETDGIADYATSRALREAYEAKLKKMEYEKASGQLVSRDEVTSKVFALARGTRDRLMQIPRRMAAALAAESDQREIEVMLDSAVRESLADLENLHDPDTQYGDFT